MDTIPAWWFAVSGICFGISILFNIALIVGGIIAWSRIGPVLTELRDQVRRLGEQGQHIAETARSTVDTVHDRTTRILGTAEDASARVTQKVGAASAALTGLFVVMRIVGFARGIMTADPPRRRQVTASS